ncbi:MAG: aminotransferase class III-fold pyridoxal phosphate-dependent enzyme [Chloroflexi bacterium]|nr:aminotransferase class III-fold pyridoxal phosphate-dependent enzyme [Chloroflexota bacterium]
MIFTAYTVATEVEILFGEHLISRNKGFEKIRFVNSGTDAVMAAIKASRAFTGRPKIAKVEGAYHGLYDCAEGWIGIPSGQFQESGGKPGGVRGGAWGGL